MAHDIITIGSATRDAFLVSKEIKLIPSQKFLTGVGECVALGTKIDLDKIVLATGGGATNAAVTFGNLGFSTSAVCRIGDDSAGFEIIEELERHNVATTLVKKVKNGQTAYSTLLTEPESGERTVLVYRGVSSSFTEADIPWAKMNSRWIYMTSLAGNVKLVQKIVQRLGAKTKIVWNPGAGDIKHGLKALTPIMKKLFLLNLNREEAAALFKTDIVKLFSSEKIHQLIPDSLTLVVTDGARGAYAYLNGTTWFIGPSEVKAISRTGAGDAFGSGLVAGLMKNWGLDDALKVGLLNAESVIQHYGAKAGIIKTWPSKSTLNAIKVKTV